MAGDVYAHNIVVDTAGHATLLDYGAAPLLVQQIALMSDLSDAGGRLPCLSSHGVPCRRIFLLQAGHLAI